MTSLEEANEAYQYIGLPGYNPHIRKDVFLKYYNRVAERVEYDKNVSEKDKVMLINSRRIFNIAETGKNYVEREDMARVYFDKIKAIEANNEGKPILLQIYVINKEYKDKKVSQNIYGFRPVIKGSYFYNRLIKNGNLEGPYKSLKKNIDWLYLPYLGESKSKEDILYICNESYFKKEEREGLRNSLKLDNNDNKYTNDYNWVYWPNLN